MKKVVVVTGAASGIGQAVARRAARDGNLVIAADIREARESVDLIRGEGGTAETHVCDVRNEMSVRMMFDAVGSAHGAVDILVNNAGTMGRWPLSITDMREDDWYTVFDTNVKGVFLCCRQVLPDMRRRRTGAIVNIASDMVYVAWEGTAVYCASKAAVAQFSRALGAEEAKYGIRVNCVCPGATDTRMLERTVGGDAERATDRTSTSAAYTALGRVAQAEEIAEVVWFVASDRAGYMVGSIVLADGGLTAFHKVQRKCENRQV